MNANQIETPKLRAVSDPWSRTVAVHLVRQDATGTYAAKPVEMRKLEGDELHAWAPPLLALSGHQAQVLMDDLWQCGVRPSEGSGSAGQLAAVQKHLEDMRALTFGSLIQSKALAGGPPAGIKTTAHVHTGEHESPNV